MSLEATPGQPRAKRFLKRLVLAGKVPHALLFSGMGGIGKSAVALEFAKVLNCLSPENNDSCGRCNSCRKIRDGNHPDMLWIRPDGASIRLDQVRAMQERVRFRPFEGKWRVIVIQDAHKLREEAANSILKILEEPAKNNLFILTVLEPQMLLPTIVSRCCHLRFQPLEESWIEQYIIKEHKLPVERAREIAGLAEGSLERVRWLIEEDFADRRKEVLDTIQQSGRASLMDFFSSVQEWAKSGKDLEQDLECIKLWVRDVVTSRLIGGRKPVRGENFVEEGIAPALSTDFFFQLYERVEEASRNLRINVNRQLTLEGLCLAIRKALNEQGSRNPLSVGR